MKGWTRCLIASVALVLVLVLAPAGISALTGSIVINSGAAYTNSSPVTLALSASDEETTVVSMQFSDDGSTWGAWEPYATSRSWPLSTGDGTKTVYVQYRDDLENISDVYSDAIILDTTLPTGSIVINGGANATNSHTVNLTLSATDTGSGVAEMRFSNDGTFGDLWEPYATSKSYVLPAGDGNKVVYVQYRDQAGNESLSYIDAIILDTLAPAGSIVINGGANATSSPAVNLALTASDAGSGVAEMRLSNDGSIWYPWQLYAASMAWSLPGGDGVRTVYVQYRDNVGNVSPSYSDTIILDTAPPSGTIAINDGAAYTGSIAVNLTLSASDAGSGVTGMRFSGNGSTWGSWEPYAAARSYVLSAGDGVKTVYVQFQDEVGHVSPSASDTIILDTLAPVGTITINGGADYTGSTAVNLALSASDAGSGGIEMRLSNGGSNWSAWEPYATSKPWALPVGDGSKTVYVQYRDNVGNLSIFYGDVITLDTLAPVGSILINGGDATTVLAAVNLALSASDAGAGVTGMRFSNDSATWSDWEPYAPVRAWTLPTGDGVKTVYVQYRDGVGNGSSSASDTIVLDTLAPVGTIAINNGDLYAGSIAVNLALSASDAGSGVAEMHLSNNGFTWSAWEPYATSKLWTMLAGDGVKTVYVQYRDYVGRISLAYEDSIILDTVAPTGSMLINDGDAYTGSTAVNLALSASDAGSGVVETRFSDNGAFWSSWQTYATPTAWTLPTGDGVKTVYVQYRDAVGNISPSYSDSIILDTTVPTGSIAIDGGAAYATSTAVELTLSASDTGSGVAEMQFSNDGATWDAWEPYATTRSYILPVGGMPPGDGDKTVYVAYRDQAGNVSAPYNATIILDTTAPTGSIAINDGDLYADSTGVELALSAEDATAGVSRMRFSNDGFTWIDWEVYAATRSWDLPSDDGAKTVYVQYEDQAGNVSSTYDDTIILDTLPPTGSIAINDGDAYTHSISATLTLAASDAGSGVAEMRLSDDGAPWSVWEPYATSKPWTLPAGDGEKTVYVEYRDHAVRTSVVYSDTIVLDTLAPVSSAASPANSLQTYFTVTWTGTDAHSGVASYDVEYRVGSDGEWIPWLSAVADSSAVFGPSAPMVVVRGATYYFQVRARDNVGNLEAYPGGDGDTSTYVEEVVTLYLPMIMQEGSP